MGPLGLSAWHWVFEWHVYQSHPAQYAQPGKWKARTKRRRRDSARYRLSRWTRILLSSRPYPNRNQPTAKCLYSYRLSKLGSPSPCLSGCRRRMLYLSLSDDTLSSSFCRSLFASLSFQMFTARDLSKLSRLLLSALSALLWSGSQCRGGWRPAGDGGWFGEVQASAGDECTRA